MQPYFKVGDRVYFEDHPEVFVIREVSANPRTKTPYRIDRYPFWVSEGELVTVYFSAEEAQPKSKKIWLVEHCNYGLLGKLSELDRVFFVSPRLPEHAEPFLAVEHAERFLDVLCSGYIFYDEKKVAFERPEFKILEYNVTWKRSQ